MKRSLLTLLILLSSSTLDAMDPGCIGRAGNEKEKLSFTAATQAKKQNLCAICHEPITAGTPTRTLRSKHPFHAACINPWFALRHNTCPTCRAIQPDRPLPSPALPAIAHLDLHTAAAEGDIAIVQALIAAGTNVNAQRIHNDVTPLLLAALGGHTTTAQLLIDAGADINAQTLDNETPLHMAVIAGHTTTVLALINAEADVNTRHTNNNTPLHNAADGENSGIVQALVEILIDAGADVNAQGAYNRTPLHLAAGKGRTATALKLIDAGADINAQDTHNSTPLDKAAFFWPQNNGTSTHRCRR